MTQAEIAELELLLAQYEGSLGGTPVTVCRRRKRLETALVRHASELIDAAKARAEGAQ